MFGCEVCYLPDRLSIQFLFYNIDIFQANSPIEMKDETALEEEVNLENELFPSSAERFFHFFFNCFKVLSEVPWSKAVPKVDINTLFFWYLCINKWFLPFSVLSIIISQHKSVLVCFIKSLNLREQSIFLHFIPNKLKLKIELFCEWWRTILLGDFLFDEETSHVRDLPDSNHNHEKNLKLNLKEEAPMWFQPGRRPTKEPSSSRFQKFFWSHLREFERSPAPSWSLWFDLKAASFPFSIWKGEI